MAADDTQTQPPSEAALIKQPKEPKPKPAPKKKTALEFALKAEAEAEAAERTAGAASLQAESFKEESNVVSDLSDHERKALDELKNLVKAALANNNFSPPPPPATAGDQTVEPSPSDVEQKIQEDQERPLAVAEKTSQEPPSTVEEKTQENPEPPSTVEDKNIQKNKELHSAVEEKIQENEEQQPAVEQKNIQENQGLQSAVEEKIQLNQEPPSAVEQKIQENQQELQSAVEEKIQEPPTADDGAKIAEAAVTAEGPVIWGVPLVGDERSDTVLLKFLRARELRAKEAMTMIKNAVNWRREFRIEALLEEELGLPELEEVVFMSGVDRDGHPVCYNAYGELRNRELYSTVLADEEKKERFVRWRIQLLERGIREELDLRPGGVSTMVQVIDLRNTGFLVKKEMREVLQLLQDNYPEFAAKQIFVNVPWWYLAFNRMISPFFTQRTKSKFVFAGPSNSAETLFKYIAPEQVPVKYGGLSKPNDPEFCTNDVVTEVTINPSMKQAIEIPVSENDRIVWELRVLGWDVSYGAEFVPSSENGYTVIIQKTRKMTENDELIVKDSFHCRESGKLVLNLDNSSSKRKKLLYRYKVKSSEAKTA